MTGEIIAADGMEHFVEAINDFEHGESEVRLLDILACEGCIAGVGFSNDDTALPAPRPDQPPRQALERGLRPGRLGGAHMHAFAGSTCRAPTPPRTSASWSSPPRREITAILRRMNKTSPEDELNCGACGYGTCRQPRDRRLPGHRRERPCACRS